MRVTLLASDEATAPLYRVRILAQVLERVAEVEVLGFNLGPHHADPLAPRDFPYHETRARRWPHFAVDARALARRATGDVLYAMKARPTSLGVALAVGRLSGRPVAVDVDDWEPYMVAPYSRHAVKNLAYSLPRLGDPNAWPYTWLASKLVAAADGVTVVSRFFQRLYGGTWLPQLVDTRRWDPARHPAERARQRFGLGRGAVVAFVGIAQPNKGTGDLLAALRTLPDPAWTLLIAGPPTPHACELAAADSRVVITGTLAPSEAPWAVAAADVVVLPQRAEPASAGQVPIKLVEAMAMARPIVATAVSDIPEILGIGGDEPCGWVIPPLAGRCDSLCATVQAVLRDREGAARRGAAARKRAQERFSYEAGADILRELMGRLESRRSRNGAG